MRGRRPLAATALVTLVLWGCGNSSDGESDVAGGDAGIGRQLVREQGCGSCHEVPGVRGADGQVGPSLDGVGGRTYLAGMLVNTPENMVRWVRSPQAVQPGNAMPDLGLTEQEARHIAAYLRTLR